MLVIIAVVMLHRTVTWIVRNIGPGRPMTGTGGKSVGDGVFDGPIKVDPFIVS